MIPTAPRRAEKRPIAEAPFAYRNKVRWGDCDPAGIVYTPRFLDYCTEAAEAWFAHVCGMNWDEIRLERKTGSPMVHCSLDFFKPLKTGQDFEVRILLTEIGHASYRLQMAGYDAGENLCFQADMVGAMINSDAIRAAPIPDDFRDRMLAYKAASEKLAHG